MVTESDIIHGLRALGLNTSSRVIVHSSLSSFGHVEGGARAVCQALLSTGATLLLPAASGKMTGIPAPPGLLRPWNAVIAASTWPEFDEAVSRAVPFSKQLPIDKELGNIPETIRRFFPHLRSHHPLMSYLALGPYAQHLIDAQRLDWPLGPLEALAEQHGSVLLLGVSHTVNTAIHLSEQHLGRSRFYRYAKMADQIWMELPNIPGDSHRFDSIEPALRPATREVMIGPCRARLIPIQEVLAAAEQLILANPAALLCDNPNCRCFAALHQRLEVLAAQGKSK
ncbi:AAC(3) family N-acetyltransferase [Ktedonosporobacter rubrisoli]|uniref:Aminoglycoside N(3)-acetyltransferase n=1 Tax=Ktedonosporobacter rubrisoli TaxID=2509675 RepID=A0A4P6JJW2_KTERU|nr:AAC(3) family N-acetyltransferase [Ktedonosporobacter rubrisoli]QBD75242.1 AAC(3) family N-acetyltransferase [Ktedonosporobacter rubrisoli]